MQQRLGSVMLFAAAGVLRCSGLRLSALGNSAARLHSTSARRGAALHATTSGARQARRAAQYDGETVAGLKVLLKERGLPVSGRRKADHCELLSADDVERQAELASAPAVDDLDDDDEEDEEDEEDDDDLPDEEEEELDAVTALSEALGAGDEGEADKDDEA